MKHYTIYDVVYIETDNCGHYVLGTKREDVDGVIFVDMKHVLTINIDGNVIIDIMEN